jgi:PhnB protein
MARNSHPAPTPVADVDEVVARAEEVSATIREPAQTFVAGDRFASILDPITPVLDRG